jgi:hypothetical protein
MAMSLGDGGVERGRRAGWYGDPWRGSRQRYWDGVRWTAATRPDPATAVRRLLMVPAAIVLAILFVLVAGIL